MVCFYMVCIIYMFDNKQYINISMDVNILNILWIMKGISK